MVCKSGLIIFLVVVTALLMSLLTALHIRSEKRALPAQMQERQRTIWTYWDTGVQNAPPYCQECFAAWARLNPMWTVRVLDAKSASKLLPKWASMCKRKKRKVQHEADLLRLMLLREFGGVWSDARILPVAPLNTWLGPDLAPTGFFAFSWEKGKHGRLTTANWFLATDRSRHPLVSKWLKKFEQAWLEEDMWNGAKNDNTGNYFRVHQLLTDLVASDVEVRQIIETMPFRHTFLGSDNALKSNRLMYKNHVNFNRKQLESIVTSFRN